MPTANAAVSRLRELAQENFVNSASKLVQLARRKGIPATSELARLALTKEVGKQIIAPPPRSVGQSAAEQPGSRLQADLIDFSKNTHTDRGMRLCSPTSSLAKPGQNHCKARTQQE